MSRIVRAPVVSAAVVAALVLLAAAVALARAGGDGRAATGPTGATGATRSAPAAPPLPRPDARLPRDDAGLAAVLTRTTRALRGGIAAWTAQGAGGAPPRAVTLLALQQQRLYRRLADDPARADRVVARLGPALRAEARDVVLARRALAAIPRAPSTRIPAVRTARAAPAPVLRAAYALAERRFGVPRDVLAAVNLVESAFGRVRSASEAGARGPMQFLPATWRRYGLGGDIDDPADAILGAANYLRAGGAPAHLRRALFGYNHDAAYVSAILRFAHRMRVDPRTFYAFYAWQVYVRTAEGTRRVTGPGLQGP